MSYTCPRCGRTSQRLEDEAQGYCGACHDFTAGVRVVMSMDLRRQFETWLRGHNWTMIRLPNIDPPTYVVEASHGIQED